ncbi:hypothetical protein FS842_006839 [Serendipita sp. 407]|nr:hypothetical protein FRC20_006729 [Serendipita sp. 405]KAG9021045.1 hypothetical protein FS842_006839 [Serendipita sp. 407]
MSPDEPRFLNGFGRALLALFEHQNKLEDLESAISHFEKAVKLSPKDHPRRPHYLHDLGNALRIRFERLGKSEDLDTSISHMHKSSDLTPIDHPDKPIRLNDLGVAYLVRFESQDSHADLEKAISILLEANTLVLDVHPSKSSVLHNCGKALRASYEHLCKIEDLNMAIWSLRKAAEHTNDQPGNLDRLLDLAVTTWERFERFGSSSDLEILVSSLNKVMTLMDSKHPDWPNCLTMLGKAYKARHERLSTTSMDQPMAITF